MGEAQWDKRTAAGCVADFFAQLADMDGKPYLAARVALRLDGLEHDLGGSSIPYRAMAVGLAPLAQRLDIGIDELLALPSRIFRLGHCRLLRPRPNRIACQTAAS